MKKFYTGLLMIIYLLSFPIGQEMMKLPILIDHYLDHKSQEPDTTLFSFFEMHYVEPPVMDSDWKDDMKLPFKSHEFSGVTLTLSVPPRKLEIPEIISVSRNTTLHDFFYQESMYPHVFRAVWQPPKI